VGAIAFIGPSRNQAHSKYLTIHLVNPPRAVGLIYTDPEKSKRSGQNLKIFFSFPNSIWERLKAKSEGLDSKAKSEGLDSKAKSEGLDSKAKSEGLDSKGQT